MTLNGTCFTQFPILITKLQSHSAFSDHFGVLQNTPAVKFVPVHIIKGRYAKVKVKKNKNNLEQYQSCITF